MKSKGKLAANVMKRRNVLCVNQIDYGRVTLYIQNAKLNVFKISSLILSVDVCGEFNFVLKFVFFIRSIPNQCQANKNNCFQ